MGGLSPRARRGEVKSSPIWPGNGQDASGDRNLNPNLFPGTAERRSDGFISTVLLNRFDPKQNARACEFFCDRLPIVRMRAFEVGGCRQSTIWSSAFDRARFARHCARHVRLRPARSGDFNPGKTLRCGRAVRQVQSRRACCQSQAAERVLLKHRKRIDWIAAGGQSVPALQVGTAGYI